MAFDQLKRETLQKVAASLLTVTGFSEAELFTIFNAKQQGLLAVTGRRSSVSPETLDRFEQLIAHCWQLSKGKQQDMALAKTTAELCLPTLTATAEQPSTQQRRAANLAAQLYRLLAVLGYHTENLSIAEAHAQNAVKYSKLADDPNLLVASLGTHALVFYYANRPERGVELCLEAEQYMDKTTYAIQSFLYRRKSACLGQLHEDDEALAVLDLALKTFNLQPSNEIPLWYAEHNQMEILLWEGITRYHVGQQDKAIVVLEQLNPHSPSIVFPERIRTGFLNNLVFAELLKSAQQRDLQKCITLWQEAAQAALDLQSELRHDEVMRAYNELLIAFPGETGLKSL
jgi:tetratricopeptide (TPR) repeat protein